MEELTDQDVMVIDEFESVFIEGIDLDKYLTFLVIGTSLLYSSTDCLVIRLGICLGLARIFFNNYVETFLDKCLGYFW